MYLPETLSKDSSGWCRVDGWVVKSFFRVPLWSNLWFETYTKLRNFVSSVSVKSEDLFCQALAGKLTEEMEMLKMSGSGLPGTTPPEKNWKNRRSQKLEKMELLNLQSNLQSEISAKQDISQELSKVRAELEASRK